ncbi:MAG: hypothetical protein H6538_04885 [Bacteroidales bacterium]|nr:hypothetical protein [Bacteroidales bacterium]MCB9013765.1 hypothetical protein [Bacteroidales bacterium]
MNKFFTLSTIIFLLCGKLAFSQDLDEILAGISQDSTATYTLGTFKGTTVINGQSIEVPGAGDLHFIISHRFGAINSGIYDFFGIDQATTRFGFEYGIKNIASLSIGRNGFNKTYDGGIKVRLLRQQTGIKSIPVSLSVFVGSYVNTLKWDDPSRENLFSSRLSYATQLLIARKFSQKLSIQLSPSYIHKNLVPLPEDQNNIFAMGLGGRYKISRKISVNAEYFYLLPGKTADDFMNSLSFGVDMETGGHVFQLQFTNSQQMFAPGFITETSGEWTAGDIYFGFNIYRVFPGKKRARNIY